MIPPSVAAELEHAEEVAHEGLKEARFAITQMRVTAVRDMGLGPALSTAFERFVDHTGLMGEYPAEPEAARFGDERAETIVRIAERGTAQCRAARKSDPRPRDAENRRRQLNWSCA